eukprot:TRINITY_DN11159_c0_g1_i1.p1 TRINITY_DN11159_c0_g1~~TRINITY_DN11159_c0_g1_i1.p1  ORF type:complete len:294 (+),score=40.17 TRINITY_DN11159_c0_g1_i1:125-883(+)
MEYTHPQRLVLCRRKCMEWRNSIQLVFFEYEEFEREDDLDQAVQALQELTKNDWIWVARCISSLPLSDGMSWGDGETSLELGEMEEDRLNGVGICFEKDEVGSVSYSMKIGKFNSGLLQEGVIIFERERWKGTFDPEEALHGRGEITYWDGFRFEAEFENGTPIGAGEMCLHPEVRRSIEDGLCIRHVEVLKDVHTLRNFCNVCFAMYCAACSSRCSTKGHVHEWKEMWYSSECQCPKNTCKSKLKRDHDAS